MKYYIIIIIINKLTHFSILEAHGDMAKMIMTYDYYIMYFIFNKWSVFPF